MNPRTGQARFHGSFGWHTETFMKANGPDRKRASYAALAAAVVLGSLFFAGSSTAQVPGTPSVFRIGDSVRITVWQNPQFSGQFDIAEDGTIIHPLYRVIRIAGLSHAEAEAEFTRVLHRFLENPEIVVEPLYRIAIGGEVRSPSIYSLPPYATLAEAITTAGGPTPLADLRRARLLRDGRQVVLDMRHPNNEFASIRIHSGDQIIMPPEVRIWRDRIEPPLRTVGSVASMAYLFLRLSDRLSR